MSKTGTLILISYSASLVFLFLAYASSLREAVQNAVMKQGGKLSEQDLDIYIAKDLDKLRTVNVLVNVREIISFISILKRSGLIVCFLILETCRDTILSHCDQSMLSSSINIAQA